MVKTTYVIIIKKYTSLLYNLTYSVCLTIIVNVKDVCYYNKW